MKIFLIICDGLGDRPIEELGDKTPLQCSQHPNFDYFARNGINGIMDIIAPGIRPGSDTSHLALLGYDPFKDYTGRGPVEAVGLGIELEDEDIAFRCNFATVDEELRVIDRRAGRIKSGTKELSKALNSIHIEGIDILFKEAVEHRGVLIFRGKGLSAELTDVDPHFEGLKVSEAKSLSENAKRTAELLNRFVSESYKVLKEHPVNKRRVKEGKLPANIILPRSGGKTPKLESIESKYGLKSACISGLTLIKGVCKLAGMDVPDVKGATGGLDTDMIAKAEKALSELETHDLVLMNIKAPDIPGHDGDYKGRIEVIERLDEMLGFVRESIAENVLIALTADHCTPVTVRNHSGDPVPITIYGKGVRVDNVKRFDELSNAQGGLGRIRGRDLIPIMLDLTNRAEKFGA